MQRQDNTDNDDDMVLLSLTDSSDKIQPAWGSLEDDIEYLEDINHFEDIEKGEPCRGDTNISVTADFVANEDKDTSASPHTFASFFALQLFLPGIFG